MQTQSSPSSRELGCRQPRGHWGWDQPSTGPSAEPKPGAHVPFSASTGPTAADGWKTVWEEPNQCPPPPSPLLDVSQ